MQGFGIGKNKERMAPAFKLPASLGTTLASWDYKQRQALVLFFLPQPGPDFLRQLAADYPAYKSWGAELLVICSLPLETVTRLGRDVPGGYPILADAEGAVYRQYLKMVELDAAGQAALPAALFIADRFGAVSRYALAGRADQLPGCDEITAMLEFLGNLCNP